MRPVADYPALNKLNRFSHGYNILPNVMVNQELQPAPVTAEHRRLLLCGEIQRCKKLDQCSSSCVADDDFIAWFRPIQKASILQPSLLLHEWKLDELDQEQLHIL